MGKTSIEQNAGIHVVTNKLMYPEAVNERELQAIAGGHMSGLLPVKAEKGKKGTVLTSSVADVVSLRSYVGGVVSKTKFFNIVSQLIAIMKHCEKGLMNINNLMLDCDYIFVQPKSQTIKCIFWPIVNNQNACSAAEFLNDLPFQMIFSRDEKHDYVPIYLQYFQNNSSFSMNGFEKLILELMGKPLKSRLHIPTDTTESGEGRGVSARLEHAKGNTGNIAYNPLGKQDAANISNEEKKHQPASPVKQAEPKFCIHCGHARVEGAKFCVNCGTSLQPGFPAPGADEISTQNFSETTVLGMEENGGTTVLGMDTFEEPVFPYLIRSKTEEKISVNKPSFRIGKERSYCDYFVMNNNAVSRSHADILTRNGRYYILDNNSTNKTYVDGRAIPVQKEIEIFSGTKLKLANEEFVFYI
ncbi:FHA domain-containing protein [Ectobacillus ponti]|uniref:FHA domain-containing protein n=1 Tax=Ectobacillus ponti TaxID=2961894 RepID=A0AA41X9J0_9BACI|nr:FHA domain-containing protein [Ectobacillus ponti]MCP8969380.1 FHA domain-containing protein [Ectobacillus ponti]